jgi:hypothetical protein
MKKIMTPPKDLIYHGVYPAEKEGDETSVSPKSLKAYLDAVGRRQVAWVVFSHEWSKGSAFPGDVVDWIDREGAVPYIRLMLRSSMAKFACEPKFTLEKIVGGAFDHELRAWGTSAAAKGVPLICEWGTEMNGAWFPWNASHNGGEAGPGLFQAAYRRLVTIIRTAGARNTTWVFHVNHENDPKDTKWNTFQVYDPGPEFTDWVGISLYGAQMPNEARTPKFSERYKEIRSELTTLAGTRAVMISEFGCTKTDAVPSGDDAGEWAKDALATILKGSWPEVRGFSWWNEGWSNGTGKSPTEMRVQEVKPLADVFVAALKKTEKLLAECPSLIEV